MSLRESDVFAPRRHRGKPERAVQKLILGWLRANGCLVAVTDAGAAHKAGAYCGDSVPPGWPDITGLLPSGRFIGIECKAPGGRQSQVQKLIEHEIRKRDGIYVLAFSVEDVTRAIEEAHERGL